MNKANGIVLVVVAGTAVMLSGCATKRYGRLQPLTSYETLNYNCSQIDLELSKVDAFDRQVAEQAKFSGMSVASFLGDFGIGNIVERNQAIKTGKERREQLMNTRSAKGCDQPQVADEVNGMPAKSAQTPPQQSEVVQPPSQTSSWWDQHKPKSDRP